MKKLLFIICLFLSLNIKAQTDTYHFPKKINCTGIEFYHNNRLIDVQVLKPDVTLVDYAGKFGFKFVDSDKYLNYVMTIRDKVAMDISPNENIYIVPTGCVTLVEIYTDVSNNIINN